MDADCWLVIAAGLGIYAAVLFVDYKARERSQLWKTTTRSRCKSKCQ